MSGLGHILYMYIQFIGLDQAQQQRKIPNPCVVADGSRDRHTWGLDWDSVKLQGEDHVLVMVLVLVTVMSVSMREMLYHLRHAGHEMVDVSAHYQPTLLPCLRVGVGGGRVEGLGIGLTRSLSFSGLTVWVDLV